MPDSVDLEDIVFEEGGRRCGFCGGEVRFRGDAVEIIKKGGCREKTPVWTPVWK